MADGTIFIAKRGTEWTVTLRSLSHGASSSLDCERGWKNRRGKYGPTEFGEGAIGDDTHRILNIFLEKVPGMAYVHIKDQDYIVFVFDTVSGSRENQEKLVALITNLLEWKEAFVEDYRPEEPQGKIVQVRRR